jgi:hypothetical protein
MWLETARVRESLPAAIGRIIDEHQDTAQAPRCTRTQRLGRRERPDRLSVAATIAYHAGGVTQEQLAERYGISQSYVSAIVRGELRAGVGGPTRAVNPSHLRSHWLIAKERAQLDGKGVDGDNGAKSGTAPDASHGARHRPSRRCPAPHDQR